MTEWLYAFQLHELKAWFAADAWTMPLKTEKSHKTSDVKKELVINKSIMLYTAICMN